MYIYYAYVYMSEVFVKRAFGGRKSVVVNIPGRKCRFEMLYAEEIVGRIAKMHLSLLAEGCVG